MREKRNDMGNRTREWLRKAEGVHLHASSELREADWTRPDRWLKHQHPELGLQMMLDVPAFPETARAAVAMHHEHMDGSGYPAKLSSEQIPPAADQPDVTTPSGVCAGVLRRVTPISDRSSRAGLPVLRRCSPASPSPMNAAHAECGCTDSRARSAPRPPQTFA